MGFYLDTLEEELLGLVSSISARGGGKAGVQAGVEEKEEEAPAQDEGWLEVGRRNRTVVTRTVRFFSFLVRGEVGVMLIGFGVLFCFGRTG